MKKKNTTAYITVIGQDRIGIIAQITSFLAKNSINILEIHQSILDSVFTMTMKVDTSASSLTIADLSEKMNKIGKDIGQVIHIHDEQIIKAMHRL